MSFTPSPKDSFHRRTFREGGRLAIESTCLRCGERIASQGSESLNDLEAGHLAHCARVERPDGRPRKTA